MIDKVMASDEDQKIKGRRRGGEIVRLDTDVDPSKGATGETQAAKASAAIAQTAEEDYEDGFDDEDDYGDGDYEDDNFEDDLLYEQDML